MRWTNDLFSCIVSEPRADQTRDEKANPSGRSGWALARRQRSGKVRHRRAARDEETIRECVRTEGGDEVSSLGCGSRRSSIKQNYGRPCNPVPLIYKQTSEQ